MNADKPAKFKAVIYDMDGVFVDTELLHYQSFVDVFRPLSVAISLDYFYSLIGEPARKNIIDIKHDFNLDIDVDKYDELLEQRYLAIVENESITPIAGIMQSLRLARILRMKIGLATTSSSEQYNLIMDSVRKHSQDPILSNHVFDAVVSGDDVEHKKPAPDPYLLAAKKLNIDPRETVVIEDSETGIQSAKSAGCYCIARRADYNRHLDLSKADQIVSSIEEIVRERFFM